MRSLNWTLPSASAWTWATVAYSACYFATHLALLQHPALRTVWAVVAFVPLPLAAAVAFALAARPADRLGLRRALLWYAASFAATSLGSLIYAVQYFLLGIDPDSSWANLPYLASYPLAAAAVLSVPHPTLDGPARWRLGLDSAIVVVAGTSLVWLLILPDLKVDASLWHQILVAAYPIGDLLIFAVLVPLILRLPRDLAGGAVRLLAFGQMLYLAGDVAYQLLDDPAELPVMAVWDVLYLAGYVGLIWAAESISLDTTGAATSVRDSEAPRAVGRNLLPLALGVGLYVFTLREAWRGGTTTAITITVSATVAVTVLILVREWITERRNVVLARALEAGRGEARLQRTIRHLGIAIVVEDADRRVRLANRRAETLLGAADGADWRLARLGRLVREDGSDLPAGDDPAALARRTGQPVRNVVLGIARPEQPAPVWLLASAEPQRTEDGRVGEVLSSFHEITDLRQLESQLRQAQKMEVVGRLAGGIAHDFNNLLTAIIGYSTIVRGQLPAGDSKITLVDEVVKASDRAAALTQQLLAFGRRQRSKPVVQDPNNVIRDAHRLLTRVLGEDVEIRLDLGVELGAVSIDPGQMEQVLLNLALNARDAMPRGGVVTIATRLAPADVAGLGADVPSSALGFVLIEVADTGTGMDRHTAERAFEPFFTTKPAGKGTGLGLSTVHGIARQNNGDVRIRTEEGVGTTIEVYLPRQMAAPVAEAAVTSPRTMRARRERILVVDDEPAICRVARRTLESDGYVVMEAHAPADASARLAAPGTAVDLLITDVVMPGQSGVDLAAAIRQARPALPVIFVTGYAEDVTLNYGLDLENSTLLAKPFSPVQLLGAVRTALDSAAASR